MNIHDKKVKSSAQKRREKKLAKLQEEAAQSCSLTNYFSCVSATTSDTEKSESSAEVDGKVEEADAKRDEEGILIH